MKAKAGDRVKVTTAEEELEGVVIQRPELLEGNFTVLKLDSGYNIGLDEKKIKKIEVLKEGKPIVSKKKKIDINKKLPFISLISTGGTISSKVDYRTGGVYADYTAEDFVEMCPELLDIANIRAEKPLSLMSEDMCVEDWKKIAKIAAKELNSDAEGVIITQGTDTLHFTTAALSFMLKNLNKPVIVTASQRSIDRGSSDAFMNLICSATAAAKFEGAEVVSCLHGTTEDTYCILNRGTKLRKMHTSRRDAFRPVNELPLAKVWKDGKIEITNKDYKRRSKGNVEVDDNFEEKIAMITVYPNMDPEIIDFYINKGYKGLVISATALGHVPTMSKNSLIPNLKKAVDKGLSVVIASQTLYGRVHPYVYTNLRKLSVEAKCIFAEDMLPETAYVKLGWVLGHTTKPEEVKKLMLANIAGEITERTEANTFLY